MEKEGGNESRRRRGDPWRAREWEATPSIGSLDGVSATDRPIDQPAATVPDRSPLIGIKESENLAPNS